MLGLALLVVRLVAHTVRRLAGRWIGRVVVRVSRLRGSIRRASVGRREIWLQRVIGLPAPLREAALDDVAGQLFAVPEREKQSSLAVVHALYFVIAAWHRRQPTTSLRVYRLAIDAVEQRLMHGGAAAADDAALDALDVPARAAVHTLSRRLAAAVDARRAQGMSVTACRGACRLVAQILDEALTTPAKRA